MNIAIVGAGLMGRLLALSLLRLGRKVTLFDKDTKLAHNSAAYAAAGLLTPLGESLHCEPTIVSMGFESLRLWPALLDSLDEYTFFQQTGAIMVSHEQDKGDYQRFVRHLNNNYPEHTKHSLNRAELLALEPEIGRSFNQGLHLPQEGQIGNRRLLIALRKQLEKEGGPDSAYTLSANKLTWLSECKVIAIQGAREGSIANAIEEGIESETDHADETSKVTYLHSGEKHSQHFDLVIDCRGTGASNKNSASACVPLTDLRSVRGELFQLFAPNVHISRPIRLMHPRYQLYIAPKQKGFYVVGATEIESDDNAPMTVRSAMELLSAAYSVHPGFAEANIRQHISQCRPAFSDNQPKITHKGRLIQVNGLFRHGFLIAPVVLQQLLALINNLIGNSQANTQARAQENTNEYSDNNLPYSDYLSTEQRQEEVI